MAGRIYATSRTGLALALGLTVSTAAFADPWDGYYIGAFAGGAWGQADFNTDAGATTPTSYFSSDANIASVARDSSGKANSRSFTGGIQLGATRRFDRFVAGADVDFSALDLSGGRGAANIAYPSDPGWNYNVRTSYSTDWLFTARGRVGWLASENLMFFATGGLAISDVKVWNSFSDTGPQIGRGGSSNRETKAGYTIGGGLELALGKSWSVKGEYLYVDLGHATAASTVDCTVIPACSIISSPFKTSVDVTANIARVGINYRLGE